MATAFKRNGVQANACRDAKKNAWINIDGYNGPERRRKQQRQYDDRRGEWRMELGKWPRRSGAGRRIGEAINLWYKDLCG